MLNFDFIHYPPPILQPMQTPALESHDNEKSAESSGGTPWWHAKRKRRSEVPMEERSANARKFAKARAKAKAEGKPNPKVILKQKKRLRPILFAADQHCSRCRVELQMVSTRLPNFASVVLPDEVLCCPKCLPTK